MKCALHLAAQLASPPVVTVLDGMAVCEPCRRFLMAEILSDPDPSSSSARVRVIRRLTPLFAQANKRD
jgi:hypothetical protein